MALAPIFSPAETSISSSFCLTPSATRQNCLKEENGHYIGKKYKQLCLQPITGSRLCQTIQRNDMRSRRLPAPMGRLIGWVLSLAAKIVEAPGRRSREGRFWRSCPVLSTSLWITRTARHFSDWSTYSLPQDPRTDDAMGNGAPDLKYMFHVDRCRLLRKPSWIAV